MIHLWLQQCHTTNKRLASARSETYGLSQVISGQSAGNPFRPPHTTILLGHTDPWLVWTSRWCCLNDHTPKVLMTHPTQLQAPLVRSHAITFWSTTTRRDSSAMRALCLWQTPCLRCYHRTMRWSNLSGNCKPIGNTKLRCASSNTALPRNFLHKQRCTIFKIQLPVGKKRGLLKKRMLNFISAIINRRKRALKL